jgi:NAD(P)-dependent dehydrogenase (short-subunit alcohol dehydrogenase family)
MADPAEGLQRTAIVTGASIGIGRAIALRLAADGMQVMLVGRDDAALRQLGEEIRGWHGAADHVVASLEDRSAAGTIVARALDRFRRLDLLVNCASATVNDDVFALTVDQWARGFEVKVFAALRLCRAAWPALKESGGSVVNIGGIGARTPRAGDAMTGALSAALMAISKSLAERGIADGVQVNMINPGLIRTPRSERLLTRALGIEDVDEAARIGAANLGATRPGRPEDVAALVAFIASREGEYLQGAIIDLDGGATRGL